MNLENLSDVHSRWNTKRIKNNINWLTAFIVRHVFNRLDHRNNTFVTMTSSHLVSWLDTTLNSKVDLNRFKYAWRQIVPAL